MDIGVYKKKAWELQKNWKKKKKQIEKSQGAWIGKTEGDENGSTWSSLFQL